MKVSRTLWIIIAASVALVALGSLGAVCWHQFSEKNRLKEELALVEEKIEKVESEQSSNRRQSLESELEETLDVMEASESLFSRPSWDIVTSSLFDIAETCNVEVTKVSSSSVSVESLGGLTSAAQKYNVSIEGTLNDIVEFITRVNHDLKTSVVKSVDINVPADAQARPSANFLLVVYTYQGG